MRASCILPSGANTTSRLSQPKSHRIQTCLLIVSFFAALALTGPAHAQLKIMPLGDSITEGVGNNSFSYRSALYSLLRVNGFATDFVGSETSGNFEDPQHEGIAGAHANTIADNVIGYLGDYNANLVLLLIGINDINAGQDVTAIRDEIVSIVNNIHAYNSRIEIYLSTVTPDTDDPDDAKVNSLNDLLTTFVNSQPVGSLVYLVDINERFKANPNWKNDYMADSVHPNNPGYEVMAQAWYDAINANHDPKQAEFTDNFNRANGGLGTDWQAHSSMKIQSNQVVNTNANDTFDKFIAIAKQIVNPRLVQFKYGDISQQTGRDNSGLAVLLDNTDQSLANGYLVLHNGNLLRLFELQNGNAVNQIQSKTASAGQVDRGETIAVEVTTDAEGHKFTVTIDGVFDGVLIDAGKRWGNGAEVYCGVQISGATIGAYQSGVDDFSATTSSDAVPPGDITNLSVVSSTASSVTLQFTAPGDDGNAGTAAAYDIRYHTSPIDANNFATRPKAEDIKSPAVASTVESIRVGQLEGGTRYYFAIRAIDDGGNTSSIATVQGATDLLSVKVDHFNRSNLGSEWFAGSGIQISNGKVINAGSGKQPAILNSRKNAQEINLVWGPEATTSGTSGSGILLMLNSADANASGYLIRRDNNANPRQTVLQHFSNGAPGAEIFRGTSQYPGDIGAGTVVTIEYVSTETTDEFTVRINGEFDRVFSVGKLYNGPYSGFLLDAAGQANAVESFSVSVPIKDPVTIEKVSGDGGTAPVNEKLADPIIVRLLDEDSNPVPGKDMTFTVTRGQATVSAPPATDGHIRIEGEDGVLQSPIKTRTDSEASGGKYMVYPSGNDVAADATYNFTITEAGTYRIWTRSLRKTSTGRTGSWDVKIDNLPGFIYDVFQGQYSDIWAWDEVTDRDSSQIVKKVHLEATNHTIVFGVRYDELWLDKIILTKDPNFVPSGLEDPGFTTNNNGEASGIVTMGGQAGAVDIKAQSGSLSTTFNLIATGGAATSIAASGSTTFSGKAGAALSQAFKVELKDGNNNPSPGQQVSWVITEGDGSLNSYTSVSDVNGLATTILTLGTFQALNKVEARATKSDGTPLNGSGLVFTANATSGVAANAAVVSGNPQTAVVRTLLSQPLVMKVTDGTQGVPNFPVEIAVKRGGGTTSLSDQIDNGGFETLANNLPTKWNTVNSPTASEVKTSTSDPRSGSRSLEVNSSRNGVGVSQAFSYAENTAYTLTFWAKVKSGTASVVWKLQGAETSTNLLPSGSSSAWVKYRMNATSTANGSQDLTFKTGANGNFFIDDVQILPVTASNGQLSAKWTLGDTAMVQEAQFTALVGASHLSGSPVRFTAAANPGAADSLKLVSGNNQIGSASQQLNQPLVVRVTDNTGINGVGNVDVQFKVTAGGGKFSDNSTTLTRKTAADGKASVTLVLGPNTATPNAVEATTTPSLKGSPVTFTASAAVPANFIPIDPKQKGSAGYTLTKPLAIAITSATGDSISGFPVIFEVLEGGGKINKQSKDTILTNAHGRAEAFLVCGETPGAINKVKATATHNSQVLGSTEFTVPTYRLFRVKIDSGDNQEGVVGEFLQNPFTAIVVDSAVKAIAKQRVTFQVLTGDGKLEGDVVKKDVTTDSLGLVRVRLRLGNRPIENRVRANGYSLGDTTSRQFKAMARVGPPDSLVKVSGDSLKGVVGNSLGTPFVVQVVDNKGNGVSGVSVIFKILEGGGRIGNQTADTLTTLGDGKAQVILTLGTTSAPYNNIVEVRAFNGSIPLRNSPMRFVATATASRATAMLDAGGNRQTGQAGKAISDFRVRVRDKDNNGVEGHPVRFIVMRGGGKFQTTGATDSTVLTNSTGIASLKLILGSVVRPDSQIVQARANDGTGELVNSPLTFVAFARAGDPSPLTSNVVASGTAPADGATRMNVTVNVRDKFGNPVSGKTVIIEVTNPPNDITQPRDTTNALGQAFGSFASTKSGPKTVTAQIPSVMAITNGTTVQFTPLAAYQISLNGGNNQTGNLRTAVDEPLSVKVADRNGNGVPGHTVTFSVASGPGKMSNGNQSETAVTDENGFAQAYFVFGTATGQSQIWAESNGLLNSPVIFIANAVDRPAKNLVAVTELTITGGIAGEELPNPVTVKVTDNSGKAVYNVPVNFSITYPVTGPGSLSASQVLSNEFGEASVRWRLSEQAGLNTVRVTSSGLNGSPIDFSATAVSGRACCLSPVSPIYYGRVNSLSDALQVKVTDQRGNGIVGYEVSFTLISGTGSLTASKATTKDGGIAQVNLMADAVSGWRRVRAEAPALSGSPVILLVYVRASAPVEMRDVTLTNNQGGTINKPLNFPLSVKLKDPYGNPTLGESVDFVITAGGGHFNGQPNVRATSDSNGVASASLTLGPSPGVNKVSALKPGLSVGSTVNFTATGYVNNFPIFQDVPDQKLRETERVEFTLRATDDDGDAVSYGAVSGTLPAGSTFDSLNTRTFTWLTTYNNSGVYEPIFTARDGKGGIDLELVRIQVANRNRAPRILSRVPDNVPDPNGMDTTLVPSPDGVARFTMKVVADDPDGDKLSYEWWKNGLLAGGNSNTFNFVSTEIFNNVAVYVSDGVDKVSTVWAVKVPVLLSSFSAAATGRGGILLQWKTGGESNHAGFNVLRSQSRNGEYVTINDGLITSGSNGDYSYRDTRVEAGARYFYKLEDVSVDGNATLHGPIEVMASQPETYELSQNYPNPFNPTTNIQYQLPKPGVVRLTIFNTLGQVVAKLVDERKEAGYHTITWNGRDERGGRARSGVYYYRLEADGFVVTKKMVLAK